MVPVFETVVQRTTRSIKVEDSEIEFAIDDGEVRAGHRRLPWCLRAFVDYWRV